MILGSSRRQAGLTLVETLVAILIFSIVTIGVVPLLASSLRGSEISQTSAVGKNVAVEAMERARGLPFRITEARNSGDVDLLDLYFPDQPNSGNSYRTTCTPADASPACPEGFVPPGYTVEFLATFVKSGSTTEEPPSLAYDAHPDSAGEKDVPPTNLLRLRVTVRWQVFGRARSFRLESLLGSHSFGDDDLRGSAVVDYVVRVTTAYPSIPVAELTVTGGNVDSLMSSRSLSISAGQRVSAADLVAVQDPAPDDTRTGTTVALEAPPDDGVSSGTVVDPPVLSILGIGDVADVEQATLTGPSANPNTAIHVGSSPEYARGVFQYPTTTTLGNLWVDKPEVSRGLTSTLKLATDKLVSVRGSTSLPFSAYSFVSAAAPGGTGLTSGASARFADLRLLPTTFLPEGVVRVTDFQADVTCNSSTVGIPDPPTATWSGTVTVSSDAAEGGTGRTVQTIQLTSNATSDPLAALRPIPAADNPAVRNLVNPMIYEEPNETGEVQDSTAGDVYLFPQTHVHRPNNAPVVTHNHPGYIQSWQSRVGGATSAGGASDPATAAIDEVIGINTVELPTATGTSPSIFVTAGSMSCEALDTR